MKITITEKKDGVWDELRLKAKEIENKELLKWESKTFNHNDYPDLMEIIKELQASIEKPKTS